MLRDKNLIPLSHQHQHALALCVRIDRASPIPESDLKIWQHEVVQLFQDEIRVHFSAEEVVVFPTASRFHDLTPLIENLLADHAALRESFAMAENNLMSAQDLAAFAGRLSAHIRKEERSLFERLQALMNRAELAAIGERLERALQSGTDSCILPNEATKLRPRK